MKIWAVLLIAALCVASVSAYTWQDDFTSDTSSSYTGTVTDLTWNTALGTGWMNDSAVTAVSEYFYSGEKFGTGSYTWQTNFAAAAGMHYPLMIWGSVENTDTGNPYNTGTHYEYLSYDGIGEQLGKVVAGGFTSLGWPGTSGWPTGQRNISVSWDSTTGDIHCYRDNSLIFDVIDGAITDPGYMGSGQTTFDVAAREYDFWRFTNGTAATPPVAAFSCAPLVTPRNGTVTCTDSSTNTPTGWDWYSPAQYTGGPTCFSGNKTNQNPQIFPVQWGYCELCLIATNAGGSDTECKGNYIYVRQP